MIKSQSYSDCVCQACARSSANGVPRDPAPESAKLLIRREVHTLTHIGTRKRRRDPQPTWPCKRHIEQHPGPNIRQRNTDPSIRWIPHCGEMSYPRLAVPTKNSGLLVQAYQQLTPPAPPKKIARRGLFSSSLLRDPKDRGIVFTRASKLYSSCFRY